MQCSGAVVSARQGPGLAGRALCASAWRRGISPARGLGWSAPAIEVVRPGIGIYHLYVWWNTTMFFFPVCI